MKKITLEEEARKLGISVAALKRRRKAKKEAREIVAAERALAPKSAGWNPRAGNKKGNR